MKNISEQEIHERLKKFFGEIYRLHKEWKLRIRSEAETWAALQMVLQKDEAEEQYQEYIESRNPLKELRDDINSHSSSLENMYNFRGREILSMFDKVVDHLDILYHLKGDSL